MNGPSETSKTHIRELEEKRKFDSRQTEPARGLSISGTQITGISLPFGDVFKLMVQIGVAMIPVGIVVTMIYMILGKIFINMVR